MLLQIYLPSCVTLIFDLLTKLQNPDIPTFVGRYYLLSWMINHRQLGTSSQLKLTEI